MKQFLLIDFACLYVRVYIVKGERAEDIERESERGRKKE